MPVTLPPTLGRLQCFRAFTLSLCPHYACRNPFNTSLARDNPHRHATFSWETPPLRATSAKHDVVPGRNGTAAMPGLGSAGRRGRVLRLPRLASRLIVIGCGRSGRLRAAGDAAEPPEPGTSPAAGVQRDAEAAEARARGHWNPECRPGWTARALANVRGRGLGCRALTWERRRRPERLLAGGAARRRRIPRDGAIDSPTARAGASGAGGSWRPGIRW